MQEGACIQGGGELITECVFCLQVDGPITGGHISKVYDIKDTTWLRGDAEVNFFT